MCTIALYQPTPHNHRRTEKVTNNLRSRLEARWFRITPVAWHNRIALKVELTRCVVCGDGFWDISEGCEDGNLMGGDGCSPLCWKESDKQVFGAPDPAVDWCHPHRMCEHCQTVNTRPQPQPSFSDPKGPASGTQSAYVDPRTKDTFTYDTPVYCPSDRPTRILDVRATDVTDSATVFGTNSDVSYATFVNSV